MRKRILFQMLVRNKDKKWFEFWKPRVTLKEYYLRCERGYLVRGERKK